MNEVTNIQQVVQQISSAERVQQIIQQQGESQQKAFAQAMMKEADQRQHEVNESPEEGRVTHEAKEGRPGQQRKRKKRGPPQASEQAETSSGEEAPSEEDDKGSKIDIRV